MQTWKYKLASNRTKKGVLQNLPILAGFVNQGVMRRVLVVENSCKALVIVVALVVVFGATGCTKLVRQEAVVAPGVTAEPVSIPEALSEAPAAPAQEFAVPAPAAAAPEGALVGKKVTLPFRVYTDRVARDNHYCPSGWMGDYGDLRLNENCKTTPHSGTTCIEIKYSAKGTQGAGWAGIYWQNPPNNWGTVKAGGFDITGATRLTFWARGEKGKEVAEFKMGGITGEYADSDTATTGSVELTSEWKQYQIDLSGLDLSYISGGFVWVTSSMDNPDGCTIYLDDIIYE